MFFGPPEPDRLAAARNAGTGKAPETTPGLPVRLASPEMWAAILAGARRRRAPRPWLPVELPAITADDIASTLVGAYLILPEVRQRPLFAEQFTEAS
jgi:hypothetical protein